MNKSHSLIKRRGFKIASVVALATLLWLGWQYLNLWDFRKELPSSATNISEWHHESGFIPDYAYLLKARLTEAEFQTYVVKFEMTPHSADRVYEDGPGGPFWRGDFGAKQDWWDPSDDLGQTFVFQKGDEWVFAKHENGWLYLKALNH